MCQLSEKHFSGEKKINSDQQMEKKIIIPRIILFSCLKPSENVLLAGELFLMLLFCKAHLEAEVHH